jgi:hypothetical protein
MIAFVTKKCAVLIQNKIPYFVFGPENLTNEAKYKLIMEKYEKMADEDVDDFIIS